MAKKKAAKEAAKQVEKKESAPKKAKLNKCRVKVKVPMKAHIFSPQKDLEYEKVNGLYRVHGEESYKKASRSKDGKLVKEVKSRASYSDFNEANFNKYFSVEA